VPSPTSATAIGLRRKSLPAFSYVAQPCACVILEYAFAASHFPRSTCSSCHVAWRRRPHPRLPESLTPTAKKTGLPHYPNRSSRLGHRRCNRPTGLMEGQARNFSIFLNPHTRFSFSPSPPKNSGLLGAHVRVTLFAIFPLGVALRGLLAYEGHVRPLSRRRHHQHWSVLPRPSSTSGVVLRQN